MVVSAISTGTAAIETWIRLYRGHAAVIKELERTLVRDHGLTHNDYEALFVLADEPDGVRRTDLAERLQLSASGVTRLLDGLERAGYVDRVACAADGRVAYAVLTAAGRDKLGAAAESHLREVERLLGSRYSGDELAALAELLGRLPGADSGSCGTR